MKKSIFFIVVVVCTLSCSTSKKLIGNWTIIAIHVKGESESQNPRRYIELQKGEKTLGGRTDNSPDMFGTWTYFKASNLLFINQNDSVQGTPSKIPTDTDIQLDTIITLNTFRAKKHSRSSEKWRVVQLSMKEMILMKEEDSTMMYLKKQHAITTE